MDIAGIAKKGLVVLILLSIPLFVCPEESDSIIEPYSAEYQYIQQIASASQDFKRKLEKILFSQSFISTSNRDALMKMSEWVKTNKYARLGELLDKLNAEEAEQLFNAFSTGYEITSLEFCPVIESFDATGQHTALSFPFSGEFFIAQGNSSWVSHKPDTSNEFALDFLIQKKGGMVFGNSAKNKNYYAWGQPVLAPADGVVKKIRSDMDDHLPLTTELNKSNYVMIQHGNGEISNIHHLMKDSIIVKEGERVKRGQQVGSIGNSGISMFPHIHYQLDRGTVDEKTQGTVKFACYFARHKDEYKWRFVFSATPLEGEYVVSVDDYLDGNIEKDPWQTAPLK